MHANAHPSSGAFKERVDGVPTELQFQPGERVLRDSAGTEFSLSLFVFRFSARDALPYAAVTISRLLHTQSPLLYSTLLVHVVDSASFPFDSSALH